MLQFFLFVFLCKIRIANARLSIVDERRNKSFLHRNSSFDLTIGWIAWHWGNVSVGDNQLANEYFDYMEMKINFTCTCQCLCEVILHSFTLCRNIFYINFLCVVFVVLKTLVLIRETARSNDLTIENKRFTIQPVQSSLFWFAFLTFKRKNRLFRLSIRF